MDNVVTNKNLITASTEIVTAYMAKYQHNPKPTIAFFTYQMDPNAHVTTTITYALPYNATAAGFSLAAFPTLLITSYNITL